RIYFEGLLNSLQAMGSTHLEAGLQKVFQHLPTESSPSLPHIILLSDGKPNRGQIATSALQKLIRTHADRCTLSSFGYGLEHDEDLLQALCREGKGGYAYIESGEVAPVAFAQELGSLFSVVGQELRLLLRPQPCCSILGNRNQRPLQYTHQGLSLDLPNMIAGQKAHLLFDLQISPSHQEGELHLLDVELCFSQISTAAEPNAQTHTPVILHVDPHNPPQINARVATQILLQDVAKAAEEAQIMADDRAFDRAIAHLEPLLKRLHVCPEVSDPTSEVSRWIEYIQDSLNIFRHPPQNKHYAHLRKTAKHELPDADGWMRKSSASRLHLNTTQRVMLKQLMEKAIGVPHAYLVVEQAPPNATPQVGAILPILGETMLGQNATVRLEHPNISQKHARLVATPEGYMLVDMMTSQPSEVNGTPIEAPTLVKHDDRLRIGPFVVRLQHGLSPELAAHPKTDSTPMPHNNQNEKFPTAYTTPSKES
ncbi:MAG: FHA domain-containing protein, partial [Myxococcota bacterium]